MRFYLDYKDDSDQQASEGGEDIDIDSSADEAAINEAKGDYKKAVKTINHNRISKAMKVTRYREKECRRQVANLDVKRDCHR